MTASALLNTIALVVFGVCLFIGFGLLPCVVGVAGAVYLKKPEALA